MKQIKNAYENIKKTCDKALLIKYPAAIPQSVSDRYNEELSYLKRSDYINDFEITRILCEEARKSSQLIQPRGLLGGSFIYYLISDSKVNPLPAHYYCPKCGYYE